VVAPSLKPWPDLPLLNPSKVFFLDVAQEQRSTLLRKFKQTANIESIPGSFKYIYFLALANERFLIALFALREQSQEGSLERRYADFSLQAIERCLVESQPIVMQELDRFLPKDELSARQRNWVIILAGGTVSGFVYQNFAEFLRDNNTNLERIHDFIQIFFPNWSPSEYGNRDLYIRIRENLFMNLFSASRIIGANIRVVIILCFYRMLKAWGIGVGFTEHGIELIDNPGSLLHEAVDHNHKRLTRMILSSRMMGCLVVLFLIRDLLSRNYRAADSYEKHWVPALKSRTLGLQKVSLETLIQSYGNCFAE
jgi:hypothetical protein